MRPKGNGSQVGQRAMFSRGLERQKWKNSWLNEVEGRFGKRIGHYDQLEALMMFNSMMKRMQEWLRFRSLK